MGSGGTYSLWPPGNSYGKKAKIGVSNKKDKIIYMFKEKRSLNIVRQASRLISTA